MKEYPADSFGNLVHDLSAHTWAVESYNAAVKHVYPFVFENKETTDEWEVDKGSLPRESGFGWV